MIMTNADQKRERGAVLVAVLWVMFAMGVVGLSFSAAIRTEVNAARNVVDQKRAYYLSRAGVEYAVFKILESRSAFAQSQQLMEGNLEQIPEVLTGSLTLQMDGGLVEVQIIDETGKISLNGALDQTFVDMVYNLLITVGVDSPTADIITDSIVDWRDPDDFYSPNGAESDYYMSLEEPYRAKNGFFDVPDELLLVRGVTPEIYYGKKGMSETGEKMDLYGLQNYFTAFTRSQAININSAPFPVLASIPYLDYQTAAQIYSLRTEGPFLNSSELMAQIPGVPTDVGQMLSSQSSGTVYTLVSTGSLEGSKVVSKIQCVIQLDGRGPKGYSIVYWNEAGTEI